MGKTKKLKPLLKLGRPATITDIFDELAINRRDQNGWVFVCGGAFPDGERILWHSLYGRPRPEVAAVLPEWASSIMAYGGRLIVEDQDVREAAYLCDCEPDYAKCISELLRSIVVSLQPEVA